MNKPRKAAPAPPAPTAPSAQPAPKAKRHKSALREWLDALLFAGLVALIIRTFFIEPYMIPSGSMERTLMTGDFIFVSKLHYGTRLPQVPLAVPLITHNKIFGRRSFLNWIVLPYARLPGLTQVKRNDVVVFNFPAEDIRPNDPALGPIHEVPMKENYIKRCVAIAGDTLAIRNGALIVNGKPGYVPAQAQFTHIVKVRKGEPFNERVLAPLGIDPLGYEHGNYQQLGADLYRMDLSDSVAALVRRFDNVESLQRETLEPGDVNPAIYPSAPNLLKYNFYHMGPLLVPKKGQTIALTPENVALYRRCIETYEGHKFALVEGKPQIDGQSAERYTFAMDYYFMMGDNRNNSEDSRYWGFVPADHVLGKPLFVLFSTARGGSFFSRLFKRIE